MSLENRQYFPTFDELPLMDEFVDPHYYQDVGGGSMLPVKHWCFFADIVDDSLSHMADFFHRVEVRDINGASCSMLFSPEQGLDYRALRRGATVFVRYAAKAYFSDLMTQVIKVDDCTFVKVIPWPLDELLLLSQWYFSGRGACSACRRPLSGACPPHPCASCEVAQYCSEACRTQHAAEHRGHCATCSELLEVVNVDYDRFIQPIPFR